VPFRYFERARRVSCQHLEAGLFVDRFRWCDSPIYMLAVGQGRTFQSFKAHLSVLQGSTFLAAKCGLPATRESKMISLPEEDPVVVGHIVNFLYTKTATPDDFREMINTYLCAGQKYHILDLKALLLQKIGTFQVADNPTRAADFFGACSEVYKEMAKPDDDFRTIFRALAQGMFGSLMGSMNWPRTLAPYLSRGGAMAEDIFSAQHGALKASSRTAQPASTQVQPAQHPVVQNTHYVQTLKKEMQAAQDSIARIRKKHDQTHRGCNCAGSHRPRANERHR